MFRVTTKESEPRSFSFLPSSPLGLGGFLSIDQLSSSAVYPRPVLQGLSFNAAFLQEVGFPPQSPIGLGGFSSTSLSHSPASRIEF